MIKPFSPSSLPPLPPPLEELPLAPLEETPPDPSIKPHSDEDLIFGSSRLKTNQNADSDDVLVRKGQLNALLAPLDAHIARADNPHSVTKAQVGLGAADNTADSAKPVSVAQQAALDLKYNASNPAGYETPAQLNARDTANRDRTNHTGAQAIGTVTGLQGALDAKANDADISLVGKSNSYNDLDNKPAIVDAGALHPGDDVSELVNDAGYVDAAGAAAAAPVQDNDPRLSDARTPTGGAGGVLSGSYPNPGFAVDMATQAELDAAIATRLPTGGTAADVNPAGTAIAAALAGKRGTTGDVNPDGNGTRSIGSAMLRWLTGWITTLRTDDIRATSNAGGVYITRPDGGIVAWFGADGLGTLSALFPGGVSCGEVEIAGTTLSFGGNTVFEFEEAQATLASIKAASILAIQDGAGTTHATISADGIALDRLTASLPLSLDANKRAVTLSAADHRALIGAIPDAPVDGSQYARKDAAWVVAATIPGTRVATLAGTDTLTTSSVTYQFLNPDGANRDVALPASGQFVIDNTGTVAANLVVKSGATTLVTLSIGFSAALIFDGTNWQVL